MNKNEEKIEEKDFDQWFIDHETALRKIVANRKNNANRNDVWVTSEVHKFYVNWKERTQEGTFAPPKNPYGFFWGAAFNKLMEGFRRFEKFQELGDRELYASVEPRVEAEELATKCLESLDFEERLVFVLHRVEKYTLGEIAEILSKSKSQVERISVRINSKIREFQLRLEHDEIQVKTSKPQVELGPEAAE